MRETWDSRETHQRHEYDGLKRPVSLIRGCEQCVERFTYAGASAQDAHHNRCGRMIRHDDPAGSLYYDTFGLAGHPLTETRRFCTSLSTPRWPASEADLETRAYTTQWRYDAVGTNIEHIDALDHVQHFKMDVTGQPCASFLDGVVLLYNTQYNAFGHVTSEHAANGVITTAHYAGADGRLSCLKTQRLDAKILQELHYQYDLVGNVVRIEDLAQPVQWFARQRIEALSLYAYDSLYQLTRATGRENASQTVGPGLPRLKAFGTKDDSRWRNYTQTYAYDSGGNLTLLKHDAGAGNIYTREMQVDTHSNRSLLKDGSPVDFAKGFDANGNQQHLAAGQVMQWDANNQLNQVTQVQREASDDSHDDVECYRYDGSGQRVRKVRRAKTRGGEQVRDVRYLPGLEIHTCALGEHFHTVIVQTARQSVRLLHWNNRQPKGIANDQYRYTQSDHLNSTTLELTQRGEVITQESYYPYGGTAWWAATHAVEATCKTVRYSGKERDASGLYYYGFRYYAPWLQRWISPDPAGDVDGLNVYRMVRNNPVTLRDIDGRMPFGKLPERINSRLPRSNTREDELSHLTANNVEPSASGARTQTVPSPTDAYAESPLPLNDIRPEKPRPGKSHSVRDLTSAYRYDTRGPAEIMNRGFEGTTSDDHLFARYGRNNVFTSTHKEGADLFRDSVEAASQKKQTLYLYKISLLTLPHFDFYREHTIKGDRSIAEIAALKFEQNRSTYSATKKYKSLGQAGFENYLFEKMHGPIAEAFVVVHELHVQGPVPPRNITPLLPKTLDYLDLAIRHAAGRAKPTSRPKA